MDHIAEFTSKKTPKNTEKFTYEKGDLEILPPKKPLAHSEKNLRRILDTGKELPANPLKGFNYGVPVNK